VATSTILGTYGLNSADVPLSNKQTNKQSKWFASLAFFKDPFWVHCCSRCTCHRSLMSFPVSVSVFHSMLMTLSCVFHWKMRELSLCCLAASSQFIGGSHWMACPGARQRSEGSLEVIDLGNVHIQPSESVRSLGVVIDNTLSFDANVNSVCKAVNYHIKARRHIRKRLTT